MNFVWLALFFPLFHLINCNENGSKSLWDDEEEIQVYQTPPHVLHIKDIFCFQKPIYRIEKINIFGDARYMKATAQANENRTQFSINVSLQRELGSNFLIFNIKLRVRPAGKVVFVTLFQLRGLYLCGFFQEFTSNTMMRYFLESEMQLSHIIACPLRATKYSLKNVSAKDLYPPNLQNGTYKFFAEVVEGTGEIAKVFALQVTTDIQVPGAQE
ncbi:hypothetical protein KR009_009994 [Drosophila setifemur]|nr:hypothetical protein KR009_009994 [Drosophila setifemur]